MAFKMNSSRISLRGSADTPGLFSTNDTDNISSGPGMGAQAPVGPGSQGEAMGPSMLDSPGNMNRPLTYFTDPNKPAAVNSSNELLRDSNQNLMKDDAVVTQGTANMGAGGKKPAKITKRTVRRTKGDDKPNAKRYGVGRIGEETTTQAGSLTKTTTKLAGTDGFVTSGPKKGMIKTASVNKIKTKGPTTNNKPQAAVLTKKKKKDSMAPMKGYKH